MLTTKTERMLALAVAFLAGCEASRVVRPDVSTAHAADAPPGAQQWDYACISPDEGDVQVEANRLGKRGWELAGAAKEGFASAARTVWCFKRPQGSSLAQ
jgi:hypothetical protein